MTFIVQTRNEVLVRGDIKNQVLETYGEDWNHIEGNFTNFKAAKNDAISKINNGIHKAQNIRVLEVVCTFESEVKITEKLSDKYNNEPTQADN